MLTTLDILSLKSISGVGDVTIRKIILSKLSINDLYSLHSSEVKSLFRGEKVLLEIKESFGRAYEQAEYNLQKFLENGISVLSFYDSAFPVNLSTIDDFPILLFCLGNIELLKSKKNVAVIGTRDNSQVGQRIASITSTFFASEGYTIVSGLARGIDSVAHESALVAKGNTIAVLVDITSIYPKENFKLAKKIIDQGSLLISENVPGTFQSKSSFVLRDRLQSGLSIGVFPIETDIQGGTMHTVGYAKKQNRLIFVPDIRNQGLIEMYAKDIVGVGFSKIRGIKYLIENGDAIPYTKENFSDVKKKLEEHAICREGHTSNKASEFYSYDLFSSANHDVQVSEVVVANNIVEPNLSIPVADVKNIENDIIETESTEFSLASLSALINSEFELLSQETLDNKQRDKLVKAVDSFRLSSKKIREQKKRGKKKK